MSYDFLVLLTVPRHPQLERYRKCAPILNAETCDPRCINMKDYRSFTYHKEIHFHGDSFHLDTSGEGGQKQDSPYQE